MVMFDVGGRWRADDVVWFPTNHSIPDMRFGNPNPIFQLSIHSGFSNLQMVEPLMTGLFRLPYSFTLPVSMAQP